jgi:type II secretory pathway pseudopilin PulG
MATMHSRSRREAMSLIEVLVVIGILGLLMGLLLPAVQRVREMAAQTGCRNNQRQIGHALQNYHAARGNLPPGYSYDETADDGGRRPSPDPRYWTFPGWSWAAHLLPFLDQKNLAEQIRWNVAVEDPDMAAVRTQILPTFACPSDRDTGVYTVLSWLNDPICEAATNSYAACYGFGGEIGEFPTGGNGLFYRNSKTRFADVRDGLSTTLAVGERAAWFCQSPWAGCIGPGTIRTNPSAGTFHAANEESPVMALAHTSALTLSREFAQPYDFFSAHPGIGFFLFADGSVRSMRANTPVEVWVAIGTRSGGEIMPEGY